MFVLGRRMLSVDDVNENINLELPSTLHYSSVMCFCVTRRCIKQPKLCDLVTSPEYVVHELCHFRYFFKHEVMVEYQSYLFPDKVLKLFGPLHGHEAM